MLIPQVDGMRNRVVRSDIVIVSLSARFISDVYLAARSL